MNEDESIGKTLFLADFFCSELAAEAYRKGGNEKDVTKLAEYLWEIILASKEEEHESNEDDEY